MTKEEFIAEMNGTAKGFADIANASRRSLQRLALYPIIGNFHIAAMMLVTGDLIYLIVSPVTFLMIWYSFNQGNECWKEAMKLREETLNARDRALLDEP